MRKIVLFMAFAFTQLSIAQTSCIVTIPDANFKNALLSHVPAIDTNGDGEIQCDEAAAFTNPLIINSKRISNLTGIEAFTALTNLYCPVNSLTSLDLSGNPELAVVDCNYNNLSSINTSANTNLVVLICYSNVLTSLNLSNNTLLHQLNCHDNQLSDLDVSSNTALVQLNCQYNPLLTGLNVANTNNANFTMLKAASNPNLTCIKVDNAQYSNSNWLNTAYFTKPTGAVWSENCSLSTPNFETFKVAVYPNPTNGIVNLSEMANVAVFDMQGRKIAENKNTASFDLSSQAAGIYLVEISTEKRTETIKIAKQ